MLFGLVLYVNNIHWTIVSRCASGQNLVGSSRPVILYKHVANAGQDRYMQLDAAKDCVRTLAEVLFHFMQGS